MPSASWLPGVPAKSEQYSSTWPGPKVATNERDSRGGPPQSARFRRVDERQVVVVHTSVVDVERHLADADEGAWRAHRVLGLVDGDAPRAAAQPVVAAAYRQEAGALVSGVARGGSVAPAASASVRPRAGSRRQVETAQALLGAKPVRRARKEHGQRDGGEQDSSAHAARHLKQRRLPVGSADAGEGRARQDAGRVAAEPLADDRLPDQRKSVVTPRLPFMREVSCSGAILRGRPAPRSP